MITWFSHALTALARRAWMSQQVARNNAARASANLVRHRRQVEDVLDYLDDHTRRQREPTGNRQARPEQARRG